MGRQTIFKVPSQNRKGRPYVVVDKYATEDVRLSWGARGLLVYLLGLPPDWKVYEKELASRSPKGVSAVRSAVKELEAHGYVKRRVIRNLNGKIKEWEITVYELPMTDFPAADYPPSENIDLENEDLENCTLLNIQDQLNIEDQQNINHTKKHMCVDIESSCHSDNPRSADTLLDFLTNPENAKGNVPKVWHVLNKYLHDDNP